MKKSCIFIKFAHIASYRPNTIFSPYLQILTKNLAKMKKNVFPKVSDRLKDAKISSFHSKDTAERSEGKLYEDIFQKKKKKIRHFC